MCRFDKVETRLGASDTDDQQQQQQQ